jgi:hypothetical protein
VGSAIGFPWSSEPRVLAAFSAALNASRALIASLLAASTGLERESEQMQAANRARIRIKTARLRVRSGSVDRRPDTDPNLTPLLTDVRCMFRD